MSSGRSISLRPSRRNFLRLGFCSSHFLTILFACQPCLLSNFALLRSFDLSGLIWPANSSVSPRRARFLKEAARSQGGRYDIQQIGCVWFAVRIASEESGSFLVSPQDLCTPGPDSLCIERFTPVKATPSGKSYRGMNGCSVDSRTDVFDAVLRSKFRKSLQIHQVLF